MVLMHKSSCDCCKIETNSMVSFDVRTVCMSCFKNDYLHLDDVSSQTHMHIFNFHLQPKSKIHTFTGFKRMLAFFFISMSCKIYYILASFLLL